MQPFPLSLTIGVVLLGSLQAQTVDFTRDVQPIFAKSCYACHSAKSQMGGLRLDAGKPNIPGSTFYQRVAGVGDQPRMPMGGQPLSAGELATIQKWVDQGTQWPEVKKHWAFIPPER